MCVYVCVCVCVCACVGTAALLTVAGLTRIPTKARGWYPASSFVMNLCMYVWLKVKINHMYVCTYGFKVKIEKIICMHVWLYVCMYGFKVKILKAFQVVPSSRRRGKGEGCRV